MRTTLIKLCFQMKSCKKAHAALCDFFNKHFGSFAGFMSTILPEAELILKKNWKDIQIKTTLSREEVIRKINASITVFRSDIAVFAIL